MRKYQVAVLLTISLFNICATTSPSRAAEDACAALRKKVQYRIGTIDLAGLSCASVQELDNAPRRKPAPARVPVAADQPASTPDVRTVLRKPVVPPPEIAAPPAGAPKPGTAEYAQEYGQRFFVRQNNLDAFYLLYPSVPKPASASGTPVDSGSASASKASGATFSWTDDLIMHTEAFNIQSYLAYVVARQLDLRGPNPSGEATPYVSKWAIAPWIYANGVLNEPAKSTDRSALQFGGEAQVEVSGLGPFQLTDFRAAPYYQTDFRGLGNIQGFDALVEPYNLNWLLGGSYHTILDDLLFFYWRAIGEADLRNVDAPGLSNMLPHTDYAWLGGSLIFKGTLFPDSTIPELANRINLTFTAQWFDSVVASSTLHDYIAEIAYNLDAPGTSSVSFQYSSGTDKSTLVKANQYKVQLNVKM